MSNKTNYKKIATQIVDKLAVNDVEDHKAIDEHDVDSTVYSCRLIGVAGIFATFHIS